MKIAVDSLTFVVVASADRNEDQDRDDVGERQQSPRAASRLAHEAPELPAEEQQRSRLALRIGVIHGDDEPHDEVVITGVDDLGGRAVHPGDRTVEDR